MSETIRFNQPHLTGNEMEYLAEVLAEGTLSGGGRFGERCRQILRESCGFRNVLLTSSCTAALEMSALLLDLEPGDEVVMPSFTYVSTATAFVRVGARPVFADIRADTLNLDESAVEAVLTERTRAIVPVHYGGVACNMEAMLRLAAARGLRLIEDAAHGLGARYRGRALGAIGDLGCLSFHDTKNVHCGQGGALCLNDAEDLPRAELLFDRGTDRARFLRGEVPQYSWVDIGSSFGLSEVHSAILCAQLEAMDWITARRARVHGWYAPELRRLEQRGLLRLPAVPEDCETNHHTAAVLLADGATRDALAAFLRQRSIEAVSHYVPLHLSPYGRALGWRTPLPVTEQSSARLLRLPLHLGLTEGDVGQVVGGLEAFFSGSGGRR